MITRNALAAVTAALISVSSGAYAHDEGANAADGRTPEKLGHVNFPTTCDPTVQPQFERGIALLHSFWFPEALKTFNEVLKGDPSCAIAYWGIGVNRLLNPFGGQPAEKVFLQGQAAVDKGQSLGAKSQRERDYIGAIATLYAHDQAPWRERVLRYKKRWSSSRSTIRRTGRHRSSMRLRSTSLPRPPTRRLRSSSRRQRSWNRSSRRSRPSRCGPLPDPQLRLSADRRKGSAGGAQLRGHRAGRRACLAHASHIFTGWGRGRIRSRRTSARRRRRERTIPRTRSCTLSTIRYTRHCSLRRMRRRCAASNVLK